MLLAQLFEIFNMIQSAPLRRISLHFLILSEVFHDLLLSHKIAWSLYTIYTLYIHSSPFIHFSAQELGNFKTTQLTHYTNEKYVIFTYISSLIYQFGHRYLKYAQKLHKRNITMCLISIQKKQILFIPIRT